MRRGDELTRPIGCRHTRTGTLTKYILTRRQERGWYKGKGKLPRKAKKAQKRQEVLALEKLLM